MVNDKSSNRESPQNIDDYQGHLSTSALLGHAAAACHWVSGVPVVLMAYKSFSNSHSILVGLSLTLEVTRENIMNSDPHNPTTAAASPNGWGICSDWKLKRRVVFQATHYWSFWEKSQRVRSILLSHPHCVARDGFEKYVLLKTVMSLVMGTFQSLHCTRWQICNLNWRFTV